MSDTKDILIPDIGGATDVEIIDIMVAVGDDVDVEQSLLTLEGDKATMDVPSPYKGKVAKIHVSLGGKVSEGSLIVTLSDVQAAEEKAGKSKAPAEKRAEPVQEAAKTTPEKRTSEVTAKPSKDFHASPSVRRIAREFGVDLSLVPGTGRKGRILRTDVQAYVKSELSKARGGLQLAPAPRIDFAKFGEIETQPLSKIKKLTGVNVHRAWVTVPHVTQFGEADITDMEAYRQANKKTAAEKGVKLTPLVFIMKAVVASLQQFPHFNSSLDETGDNLIMKKYFHIGIAADTPNGLVVPVIRDVDQKDIYQLAKELGDISQKAREKGLTPAEMAGSTFTISSLGGIGGTAFTPIVKAPDVAILGVSRSKMQPVYENNEFVPRLMLPLSLSYDHRVIDGADGARFIMYLSDQLSTIHTNV